MKNPKLMECSTNPRIDPFHANTGGETYTQFFIDLRDGHYGIVQECNDNSTPVDEWNNIVWTARLGLRPDEVEARAYLASADAIALVQRVVDGGEVNWNGSNHVGSLNDDAQAALAGLIAELDALPENAWSLWAIGDWAHEWASQNVTSATTNAEILRMAEELAEIAESDCVILVGDITEYLYERREAQMDDPLSVDNAANVLDMTSRHVRRLIADGKLAAHKVGRDWLIDPCDLRGIERQKAGRPRKTAPDAA